MHDLKLRLKMLIVEALRLEGVEASAIPDDAPLFGEGPLNLDSVDALELVLEIERAFDLRLDDDTRTREVLRSVNTLAEFLAPRIGRAPLTGTDAG